jgi:diguanylate cyclase (GGDEF)-like protein
MGRKTIAFLLDMLYEDYAIEAWKSAIVIAKELGLRLLAFTGGNLKREDSENRLRNEVYKLVGPASAHAIVSLSAALANTVGTSAFLEFCRRFEPLPIAHIGIEAPGISFFRANGYTGTRGAVEHLIDVHGRRAIAHIRGPVGVIDADERYLGYIEALAGRGIPFDPELVYLGDFYRESGEQAIRALIDERGKKFDAIVSANDYMANYAMRELSARGIRVPQDVSVVGFDDIAVARTSTPPLSTIRQPIHEIVKQAMMSIASAIEEDAMVSGRAPEKGIISADLILRRSCGCQPLAKSTFDLEGLSCSREAELFYKTKVSDEFSHFVKTGSLDEALTLIINAENRRESFTSLFTEAHSAFKAAKVPFEKAFALLTILVQAESERSSALERAQRDEDKQLQRITGNLMSALGPDRLGKGLAEVVRRAGIKFFLAVEFTEEGMARVIMSSVPGIEAKCFDPSLIAPPEASEFVSQDSLVVLPLYMREQSLGYFVIDAVADRPALLELLREHLSSAIMADRTETRERNRASELEALVIKRTADLERALDEIGQAKERIECISITDELTGALNRRGFFKTAERECAMAMRRKHGLALAFIDIDGLKTVNDKFGHKEGDWLISSTAVVLKDVFRSTDIIGRMGGDEFLVLAIDCVEEDIKKVRQRIEKRLLALNASKQKPYALMLSMGAVLFDGTQAPRLDELIAQADLLLYEEKRSKRAVLI